MRIIIDKDIIKGAKDKWKKQYSADIGSGNRFDKVYEKLKKLKRPTAKKINDIIGNDSWTTFMCDECNESKREGVMFNEDSYECCCELCFDCLEKALRLMKGGGNGI